MAFDRMPPLFKSNIGKKVILISRHTLSGKRLHQIYCGKIFSDTVHRFTATDQFAAANMLHLYLIAAYIAFI
jgi:hypothetical protein